MYINALIGGLMVGVSAVLLMKLVGRIAGLSGIIRGLFSPFSESSWRWQFAFGVLLGSLVFNWTNHQSSTPEISLSSPLIIIAGLLVGAGSVMGGGCTSGHGVCGLARLSKRSSVAVLVFMLMAMLTTWLKLHVFHLS